MERKTRPAQGWVFLESTGEGEGLVIDVGVDQDLTDIGAEVTYDLEARTIDFLGMVVVERDSIEGMEGLVRDDN